MSSYAEKAAPVLFRHYADGKTVSSIDYSSDRGIFGRPNFATAVLEDGRVMVLETKLYAPLTAKDISQIRLAPESVSPPAPKAFPPMTVLHVFDPTGRLETVLTYKQTGESDPVSCEIEDRKTDFTEEEHQHTAQGLRHSALQKGSSVEIPEESTVTAGFGLRFWREHANLVVTAANRAISQHSEWNAKSIVHFSETVENVAADAAAKAEAKAATDAKSGFTAKALEARGTDRSGGRVNLNPGNAGQGRG